MLSLCTLQKWIRFDFKLSASHQYGRLETGSKHSRRSPAAEAWASLRMISQIVVGLQLVRMFGKLFWQLIRGKNFLFFKRTQMKFKSSHSNANAFLRRSREFALLRWINRVQILKMFVNASCENFKDILKSGVLQQIGGPRRTKKLILTCAHSLRVSTLSVTFIWTVKRSKIRQPLECALQKALIGRDHLRTIRMGDTLDTSLGPASCLLLRVNAADCYSTVVARETSNRTLYRLSKALCKTYNLESTM